MGSIGYQEYKSLEESVVEEVETKESQEVIPEEVVPTAEETNE